MDFISNLTADLDPCIVVSAVAVLLSAFLLGPVGLTVGDVQHMLPWLAFVLAPAGIGLAAFQSGQINPSRWLPRRLRFWPSPLEVFQTADGRGMAVRTRRRYEPGDIIFAERPLLRWRVDAGFREYAIAFLQLPASARSAILELYCPADHGEAGSDDKVDEILSGSGVPPSELPTARAQLWKFLRVADLNATGGSGFCALYRSFSRMNHTCEPNVCVVIQDSGEMFWIAASPVRPGDELCTEYLDMSRSLPLQDTLRLPTAMRQERLLRWGFTCGCRRCEAPCEPERAFTCQAASCGRGRCFAMRPRNGAGCRGQEEALTACDACGTDPPQEVGACRLAEEAKLVKEAERVLTSLLAGSQLHEGAASDAVLSAVQSLGERCVAGGGCGPSGAAGARGVGLDSAHWLIGWLRVLDGDDDVLHTHTAERVKQYFEVCRQAQAMADLGQLE